MAETMLITQALDERDFLLKKINRAINDLKVIACVREKDTAINGLNIEKFEAEAKSQYQSITDMMDRYDRINRAITLSNANLTITFSDGTVMTKAEAIAKKKIMILGFSYALLDTIREQYQSASRDYTNIISKYNRSREDAMTTLLGNQKAEKITEEQTKVIDSFTKPLAPKMIDPLNAKGLLEELNNKFDIFKTEVDTLIKVSNATNTIEF